MANPYIKFEDNFIVIHNLIPQNEWAVYDIDLERFKTEKDLEEWVEHLKNKNWFSVSLEKELRTIFKKINGKK